MYPFILNLISLVDGTGLRIYTFKSTTNTSDVDKPSYYTLLFAIHTYLRI